MKKFPAFLFLAVAALCLASCTTPFMMYQRDMFDGKNLMDHEEYGKARDSFLKAAGIEHDGASYAFSATASYKMRDLPAAYGYIEKAEKANGNFRSYLRISGYKALILLRQGRKTEGMAALKEYIDIYRRSYPLNNLQYVEDMWKQDKVKMELLEVLIDEQVTNYETEVAQMNDTWTGFYERHF